MIHLAERIHCVGQVLCVELAPFNHGNSCVGYFLKQHWTAMIHLAESIHCVGQVLCVEVAPFNPGNCCLGYFLKQHWTAMIHLAESIHCHRNISSIALCQSTRTSFFQSRQYVVTL